MFSDGRDLLPRIHQLLQHSQQSCGAASTALALILPGTLSFRVEQSPDVRIPAATREKKKNKNKRTVTLSAGQEGLRIFQRENQAEGT